MLNSGRNPGIKLWLLAKLSGAKPNLWLNSPLQILLTVKNRIGYPLVSATIRLAVRSRFELHLPDCDKQKKPGTLVPGFFCLIQPSPETTAAKE